MAEALWRLRGGRVRLLTAVGDDSDGRYLASVAPGLLLDGCVIKDARTPTYAAILDAKGECLMGLGDMGLHSHITSEMVDKHKKVLQQAPLVIFDGNIPESTMEHVMQLCNSMKKPVQCAYPSNGYKNISIIRTD
ncbi:uncharacterized protein LOC114351343 [Ostrinia furnacalis]|uniref:uncharacterized protein LOC114351343 n=1 Tax=Ostrinia furnacalis TaxID=93504 RepID=UPI0010397BCF|nr:uncharacterized protein LOC114351343 [Ostrinia furnacalis]